MDLPDQGCDLQVGQPDFSDGGQGQDCQLQQQATGRGINEYLGQ